MLHHLTLTDIGYGPHGFANGRYRDAACPEDRERKGGNGQVDREIQRRRAVVISFQGVLENLGATYLQPVFE